MNQRFIQYPKLLLLKLRDSVVWQVGNSFHIKLGITLSENILSMFLYIDAYYDKGENR